MSIKAMNWAWELAELPLRESMVLLALADAANDDGLCWPSQDTLAMKARSSTRSVKRAISMLKDADLIEVIPQSSVNGRRANLYRVCVGVEYSAESRQRAKLALSERVHDDVPVDNASIPFESGEGPNWHLADEPVDNVLQSANGGPSQSANGGPLLPYGEEPPERTTNQPAAQPPAGGVVGDDREPEADQYEGMVPLWDMLDAALPAPMRSGLNRAAGVTLTVEVGRALAGGWTKRQIYDALNSNPLPASMRNRTGLVIHRVTELSHTPPPAPTRQPYTPPDIEQRAEDPVPMPDDLKSWFKEKYPERLADVRISEGTLS